MSKHEQPARKPHYSGSLFIVSAPSGAGKSSLVKALLAEVQGVGLSISNTTRKARPGEVDGKDYYFIGVEGFRAKIAAGAFVEWEEVYTDNFYGTLKTEVERIWALGKHVIFDIDVAGGLRIKHKFPNETLAVFVKPPSVDELKRRLKQRSTESEDKINMRIAKASVELATAPQFDTIIKNYDLDVAKEDAYQLVKKFINTNSTN